MDVAIIGIACRLPGASNPEELWSNLLQKVDSVKNFPSTRWSKSYFTSGVIASQRAGLLDEHNLEFFDFSAFGINGQEAKSMDIQQRLLLEVTWEALEDAGIDLSRETSRKTGVFVGTGYPDFSGAQMSDLELITPYTQTGQAFSIHANRISYCFDFTGPSMAVDTACSSSLVNVHLACKSIESGDCEMAVAGGISLLLEPNMSVAFSRLGVLSKDGKCKSFDASADGYVRGEGLGMLVLKKLDKAEKDGDRIYAVIKGSAINVDGSQRSAITSPNKITQIENLKSAWKNSGVSPSEVSYIEMHGTGTKVGDTVEAHSVGEFFNVSRQTPLYIGSVKTNIGHLEWASGVAGVIKVLLQMKYKTLIPNLHFSTPNPDIPFDDLNLKVVEEPISLIGSSAPLLMAINSFGFGGTNAHLILQEYNPQREQKPLSLSKFVTPLEVITLSAKHEASLRALCLSMYNTLKSSPLNNITLSEFAIMCNKYKTHHNIRLALVVSTFDELLAKLSQIVQNDSFTTPRVTHGSKAIVFVMCGQGPQSLNMAAQLYEECAVFKETLDHCDHLFQKHSNYSLVSRWLIKKDITDEEMTDPLIAQPTIFFVQIGLLHMWRNWGVEPTAVVGHSMGEVAAFYASGALSIEEAIRIIYHRSVLQQRTVGKGNMLAASISPEMAKEFSNVEIAAINSPSSITLAGEIDELKRISQILNEKKIFNRLLRGRCGFHSKYQNDIESDTIKLLSDTQYSPIKIPLYSSVHGGLIDKSEQIEANYWWNNIRHKVRFSDAVQSLFSQLRDENIIFIELGPHPVLQSSIQECAGDRAFSVLTSMKRQASDTETFLTAVGQLYTQGAVNDLWTQSSVPSFSNLTSKFPLIKYSWNHQQSIPFNEGEFKQKKRLNGPDTSLLGHNIYQSSNMQVWETRLNFTTYGDLWDHTVAEDPLFPAVGYVALCMELAQTLNWGSFEVNSLHILEPLLLPTDSSFVVLHTQAIACMYNTYEVQFLEPSSQQTPKLHAKGFIQYIPPKDISIDITAIESKCVNQSYNNTEVYTFMKQIGFNYGPFFRGVQSSKLGSDSNVSHIVPKNNKFMNTATLECSVHSTLLMIPNTYKSFIYLQKCPRVAIYDSLVHPHLVVHGKNCRSSEGSFESDCDLMTPDGKVVAQFFGLQVSRLSSESNSTDRYVYEMGFEEEVKSMNTIKSPTLREWTIFGSGSAFSDELCTLFKPKMVVTSGTCLKSIFSSLHENSGIIHCWGVDDAKGTAWISAVEILKIIIDTKLPIPVWILYQSSKHPLSASLEGLCRTVKSEHMDMKVYIIDVDNEQSGHIVQQLICGVSETSTEFEYKIVGDIIKVPKIKRLSLPNQGIDKSVPQVLEMTQSSRFDSMQFKRLIRKPSLYDNEVEIQVKFVGLNFKDVMFALGMMPDTYLGSNKNVNPSLGFECSGIVSRIGSLVTRCKVGDKVYLISATTAFASHTYANQNSVAIIPDNISMEQAASSLVVYLTAYVALVEKSGIAAGDKVLIHRATGGVGLAAVSLAKHYKAEIFATVGTDQKRKFLEESPKYHVDHIFNSRNLEFTDQVKRITNGYGVDILINSLEGPEAISKNFEVLAPFGRYNDISVKDVYDNTPIGLKIFHNNSSYHSIDLEHMRRKLSNFDKYVDAITDLMHRGLIPPVPHTIFPHDKIQDAFRQLSQGKHIGKFVVDMQNLYTEDNGGYELNAMFKKNASYLVVGGTRGIGLEIANWLSKNGAGSLVLISKSGVVDNLDLFNAIKTTSNVYIFKSDVTDSHQVTKLFADISSLPPIKGIFHLATLYCDELFKDLSIENFDLVVKTKALSAYNLHNAARSLPLDYFVMFSSLSSAFGNHAQSSYAASNSILNALAQQRKANGLPALSIIMGAIGGRGVLARSYSTQLLLTNKGILSIPIQQLLQGIESLLCNQHKITPCPFLSFLSWTRLSSAYPHLNENKFSYMQSEVETNSQAEINTDHMTVDSLNQVIKQQFAKLLSVDDVDSENSLHDYGFDSLAAVQLKNWIDKEFGRGIVTQMELIQAPSISYISEQIFSRYDPSNTKLPTPALKNIPKQTSALEVQKLTPARDNTTLTIAPKPQPLQTKPLLSPSLSEVAPTIPMSPNKNNAFILGIGTANPPFVKQTDFLEALLLQYPNMTPDQENWLRNLYNGTAIDQRGCIFDITKRKLSELDTIETRNKIYIEHAPNIAATAARKALEEAQCLPEEITHVVSASCTGVVVPDINFLMIDKLGLSHNVERVSVNYMGCFAGLTALKTARALACLHPKNRVLVLCTEFSSVHYNTNPKHDILVAMAIFGDGSAAFVVGQDPRPHEKPIYEIIHTATCGIPDSIEMMAWEMTNSGWLLGLSPDIPGAIYANLPPFVERLFSEAIERNPSAQIPTDYKTCSYALHPGGKAILHSIAQSLDLTTAQTASSFEVLRKFGNMSGGSIIFSMDELRRANKNPSPWVCALSFGPGLSVEGAILRYSQPFNVKTLKKMSI